MTNGVANSITQSSIGQKLLKLTLSTYFSISYPWTVRLYNIFIDSFINNPLPQAPILYFYSRDDPMCDSQSMKEIIERQKNLGYDVSYKDWKSSGHVQHYVNHTTEYLNHLDDFLIKINPENSKLLRSKF